MILGGILFAVIVVLCYAFIFSYDIEEVIGGLLCFGYLLLSHYGIIDIPAIILAMPFIVFFSEADFYMSVGRRISQKTIGEDNLKLKMANYDKDKINEIRKAYSMFFRWEGLILWGGIVFLFYMNSISFCDTIENFLRTGIYVPIVFLLCSKLIKLVAQKKLKGFSVSDKELSDSIMMIVIVFDCCLFIVNLDMAVYVLAIILGKMVWLDGSLQELYLYIKSIYKYTNNKEQSLTSEMIIIFNKEFMFCSICYIVLFTIYYKLGFFDISWIGVNFGHF